MSGFSTSRVHPLQLFAAVAMFAVALVAGCTSDSYGCPPQQLQQQLNSGCYQQQALVAPYAVQQLVVPQRIVVQRYVQPQQIVSHHVAQQQVVVQKVRAPLVQRIEVAPQRSVTRQRIVTRTR